MCRGSCIGSWWCGGLRTNLDHCRWLAYRHCRPAFAAHESTIGMCAEVIWEGWLLRAAMQKLIEHAKRTLAGRAYPWAMAHGSAAACVASMQRIGWRITDEYSFETDIGYHIDLKRDSPAMVRAFVRQAVRRWRWRCLEHKHAHLKQGAVPVAEFPR